MKKLPLLAVLALSLALSSCYTKVAKPLEAVDFKKMLDKNPDAQIIDVRTFDEFFSGHIGDAYNIDFYHPKFIEGLDTLDRNKPVAVYCLVGQRSAEAYKMLVEMDFKKVYHLTGGTVAWRREKFDINEGGGRYELR